MSHLLGKINYGIVSGYIIINNLHNTFTCKLFKKISLPDVKNFKMSLPRLIIYQETSTVPAISFAKMKMINSIYFVPRNRKEGLLQKIQYTEQNSK